jgi:hypothetical protein
VKLEGERESLSSRNIGSKGLQVSGVVKRAEGAWASFYSPKRNLPIGVSEIRTCPTRGPDMSAKGYWNPALAPDISGAGT